MKPFLKNLGAFLKKNAVPLFISAALLGLVSFNVATDMARENFTYSQFSREVNNGNVTSVTFVGNDNRLRGKLANGHQFELQYPSGLSSKLPDRLAAQHISIKVKDPKFWDIVMIYGLPTGLFVLASISFVKKNRKKQHKGWSSDVPTETLEDVVGAPEAVDAMRQLVSFLRKPEVLESKGIRLERGVILFGPPGTGKTLLARAAAGSAGVKYFFVSGAGFSQKYAGETTVMVRNMLDAVIAYAQPCIVFIDEVDVIAGVRKNDNGADDDRAEATTQLMNKVEEVLARNPYAVIIGTTNRLSIIDPAAKRPGRLGLHVAMPHPDANGREALFRAKAKLLPNLGEVDFAALVSLSVGMSGAQVSAVPPKAALLAHTAGSAKIETWHFVEALAAQALGIPRTHQDVTLRDARLTAVHESGHTIVAAKLNHGLNPYRVTIVPTGSAGGSTWLVGEDRPYLDRKTAITHLAIAMAGAAAEQIDMNGDCTSGTADDRIKATELARAMVCQWGMGDIHGTVNPDHIEDDPRAGAILATVEELIHEAEDTARRTIDEHRQDFDKLVKELLLHKTLSGQQLADTIGEDGVLILA